MTDTRPLPVLTLEAMNGDDGPEDYEPALSYPLPEHPTLALLDEARGRRCLIISIMYRACCPN